MFFSDVCMGVDGGMKERRKREGGFGFEMKNIIYSVTTPGESKGIPVHTGMYSACDAPEGLV